MKSSDQIRSEIVAEYERSAPFREQLQKYSTTVYNLSIDYHKTRLAELGIDMVDTAVVAVLDVRNTPKTTDKVLEELTASGVKFNRAVRDVGTDKIYLMYEAP